MRERTIQNAFVVAVVAVVVAGATPAFAGVCDQDAKAFCAGMSGAGALSCLKANVANLPDACCGAVVGGKTRGIIGSQSGSWAK